MFKRLVLILSLTLVFTNFVACTSSDPADDSETVEESGSLDVSEDGSSAEGEESLDVAEGEEAAPAEGEETLEVAEGEEGATQEPQVSEDTLPEEALADSELSLDEEIAASEASTEEPGVNTDAVASTEEAPTEPAPADTFAEAPPMEIQDSAPTETTEVAQSEKPSFSAPLQKVPTAPWRQSGVLYNSVYFAKPGDTLKSISQKIYGDGSKVSELRKGNGVFASRGVLPGDKVYYNSPTRPTDDSRVMSYYEEKGMAPQVYIAQEGDRLRPVSQKLLGYSAAWKEIWSSNSFDSKGDLAPGTEIRYYPDTGSSAPAPVLADASFTQPQSMPTMPAELPPPPPAQEEFNSPPPPPDMQPPPPTATAATDLPPPPPPDMPPPVADIPPPPPPPPMAMNDAPTAGDMGMDGAAPFYEDPMVALVLAAGGLVLLGVIVMASRRRRHQRELEQALAQHNVG